MARDAAVWFVMIGGQQAGPMSRAEVGLEFATGAIDGDSYVWKEGMAGWLPGLEVPELAQLFEPEPAPSARPMPPPPPPAALQAKARGEPAPAARKKPGEGMPTFDTSHFKVREGIEDQDQPASKVPEFNTSHFKVKGAPDESSLSLEMNLPLHKPGVAGYPDAPKPQPLAPAKSTPAQVVPATPKPAVTVREEPPGDDGDWSDRTNVEMLPFGERIHQEKVASELFDANAETTSSSRALDLSKWASKEMGGGKSTAKPPPQQAARAATPMPVARAPAKSKTPFLVAVVLAAALLIAGLVYLLG
jgi:hypothetical protein